MQTPIEPEIHEPNDEELLLATNVSKLPEGERETPPMPPYRPHKKHKETPKEPSIRKVVKQNFYPDGVWTLARLAYQNAPDVPLSAIALLLNCPASSVRMRARREGWKSQYRQTFERKRIVNEILSDLLEHELTKKHKIPRETLENKIAFMPDEELAGGLMIAPCSTDPKYTSSNSMFSAAGTDPYEISKKLSEIQPKIPENTQNPTPPNTIYPNTTTLSQNGTTIHQTNTHLHQNNTNLCQNGTTSPQQGHNISKIAPKWHNNSTTNTQNNHNIHNQIQPTQKLYTNTNINNLQNTTPNTTNSTENKSSMGEGCAPPDISPENSENSGNPENYSRGSSENSENSENYGNYSRGSSENPENYGNPENSENSENPENTENSENPENTENPENYENPENSENSENSENYENSGNSVGSGVSGGSVDSGGSIIVGGVSGSSKKASGVGTVSALRKTIFQRAEELTKDMSVGMARKGDKHRALVVQITEEIMEQVAKMVEGGGGLELLGAADKLDKVDKIARRNLGLEEKNAGQQAVLGIVMMGSPEARPVPVGAFEVPKKLESGVSCGVGGDLPEKAGDGGVIDVEVEAGVVKLEDEVS